MIKLYTNYEMQFNSRNLIDWFKREDLREKLFASIVTHLHKYNIVIKRMEGNHKPLLLESDTLSLLEHDDYYWIVTEKKGIDSHCKGIFYGFDDAIDQFVFHLIKPYPRTIDWESLLKNESFIRQACSINESKYFFVTIDQASKWLRVESDFPPSFFKPDMGIFEQFGYVNGQKIIFEAIRRYLGDDAEKLKPDIRLGKMGRDWGDYTICEAGGYWLVTNGERGSVYFGSLFCSYRDAVDFYIYVKWGNKVNKCQIPWKDLFAD